LGTIENPQKVKLNVALIKLVAINTEILFNEYKDILVWNYTILKGIPPKIAQHPFKQVFHFVEYLHFIS
jgi:hypothetical protein